MYLMFGKVSIFKRTTNLLPGFAWFCPSFPKKITFFPLNSIEKAQLSSLPPFPYLVTNKQNFRILTSKDKQFWYIYMVLQKIWEISTAFPFSKNSKPLLFLLSVYSCFRILLGTIFKIAKLACFVSCPLEDWNLPKNTA